MKINLIYRILLIPNLIHELLHCLPAWLWGLHPSIDCKWSKMHHRRTTNGKTLTITLMPAFVGFIALPFVWLMIANEMSFSFAVAIFWIGWMLGCGNDFYKAGYFILFRKWRNRKET